MHVAPACDNLQGRVSVFIYKRMRKRRRAEGDAPEVTGTQYFNKCTPPEQDTDTGSLRAVETGL